ncbi:hypothetical protein ACFQ3W_01790 [Paenibacillus puldeungensis]|uniref:Uncharacterized protein n=1 Tax=Paenibacillus puldeungensis TaxID=696536 RepID=A0ABW3RRH0_9BACL
MYMDSLELAKQRAEDLRKEIEKCNRGERMRLIRKMKSLSMQKQALPGKKRFSLLKPILMIFRRLL